MNVQRKRLTQLLEPGLQASMAVAADGAATTTAALAAAVARFERACLRVAVSGVHATTDERVRARIAADRIMVAMVAEK